MASEFLYWAGGRPITDGAQVRRGDLDGFSHSRLYDGHTETLGLTTAVNDTTNQVIFTVRDFIQNDLSFYTSNFDGSSRVRIKHITSDPARDTSRAFGLAVDEARGHIYYTNGWAGLGRMNMDGTNDTEILPAGTATSPQLLGLGIDTSNDNLYYFRHVSDGDVSLRRCTLGGESVTELLTNLQDPVFLALDVANSYIYWTDEGPTQTRVYRCNLDGTGQIALLGSTSVYVDPAGIAVDSARGLLYVAFGSNPTSESGIYEMSILGGESTVSLRYSAPEGPAGLAISTSVPPGSSNDTDKFSYRLTPTRRVYHIP